LVPGNDGYCLENCKSTCANMGNDGAGSADTASSSGSASPAAADDSTVGSAEVGLFGRASGGGVEKLAASLFGATKQGSDPNVADKDAYVGGILDSLSELTGK